MVNFCFKISCLKLSFSTKYEEKSIKTQSVYFLNKEMPVDAKNSNKQASYLLFKMTQN